MRGCQDWERENSPEMKAGQGSAVLTKICDLSLEIRDWPQGQIGRMWAQICLVPAHPQVVPYMAAWHGLWALYSKPPLCPHTHSRNCSTGREH